VTPALKRVYGADHGVFVEEVQPDTPAARAGVKPEDVIVRYDGKDVTTQDQFVTAVQHTRPGRTVDMQVLRDGKTQTLKITVEALSLEAAVKREARAEGGKLGLTADSLPADRANEIGVAGGVVVRAVNPRGEAARAGIQPGDVIVSINRRAVKDVGSYQEAEAKLEKGEPVVIRVWRADRMFTAQIERLGE
jgi:serine protease Do